MNLTNDDILRLVDTHGLNAYRIAQVTGHDHSSIARRIRNLGLRPKQLEVEKDIRHIVIPDCQVKDEVDISYLEHIGKFIAEKRPDKVICIGDFADMPSLSSYDKGKRAFEGRRYRKDIESAKRGMEKLVEPFNHLPDYNPELYLTLGNHENRINRAIENDAVLDGTIGIEDLKYPDFGWKVSEFLDPIKLDGIMYAHYFTSGVLGRPVSSARVLCNKKHQSCVMGHVQNWDQCREVRADGTPFIGLFVGSCYLHNEDYLGPQGNNYWRGIWELVEIKDGDFQPVPISLNYLRKRYANR